MKKLFVSTLCGLCLMAAFACAAQPTNEAASEVAVGRRNNIVRA